MTLTLPRWRFLNLQSFLLGLGFILLVGISAATIYLVERGASDGRLLADTLSVEDKLSDVLLTVRRAESSQRGYLLTNDKSYLDDFNDAEPEAQETITELRGLSENSATRQSTLDNVSNLVAGKFREMRRIVELNESGQRATAMAHVREGEGRRIMLALRDVIEDAIEVENNLADVRSEASRRTNTLLLWVTLIGAALIVGIGGLSVMLVQRNYRRAEIARQELAGTNANLERIVEFRTADLTEANEEIQPPSWRRCGRTFSGSWTRSGRRWPASRASPRLLSTPSRKTRPPGRSGATSTRPSASSRRRSGTWTG